MTKKDIWLKLVLLETRAMAMQEIPATVHTR